MLQSSCLPDELVTLVDDQTSGKRMHSSEMTLNSFFKEKLTVRERDDDDDGSEQIGKVKTEEVMQFPANMSISKVNTEKVMQFPVNMGNSDYNLDSLITWCSNLRMLIRATAYFRRMMGLRNLCLAKKG